MSALGGPDSLVQLDVPLRHRGLGKALLHPPAPGLAHGPPAGRRRGSASRARCASAGTSRSGTSRPVTPGTLTSRTALGSAVVITGRPAAIASSTTSPNISSTVTDGSTRKSASAMRRGRSSSGYSPYQRTRSVIASACARVRSRGPSGPGAHDVEPELGHPLERAEQDVEPLVGHQPADEDRPRRGTRRRRRHHLPARLVDAERE